MILSELLKIICEKEQYNSTEIVINNNLIYIDYVDMFTTIDPIKTTLIPLGFRDCLEFRYNIDHKVWISDNRDLISYWEYDLNNEVPFVFDIQDILDNNLDYLVLKYGKNLQKQIKIS